MDRFEKIRNLLANINNGKKIKIRMRKKSLSKYSLYFDLCKDNERTTEYIKRYILGTKESENADKETLRYVIAMRDKKELDLLLEDTGFKLKKKELQKADFVEYFKSLAEKKNGSTKRKWLSLYRHLSEFTKGKISIQAITPKFCSQFYDYLLGIGNNSTPKVYYKVFSAALNQLVLDDVLQSNPALKAKNNPDMKNKLQQNKEQIREFLTEKEVQKLINTPISNREIRNAFLFSCFTGLRKSDIENLKFSDINEGYLYFRQLKTKEDDRMKLHPRALEIVEEHRKFKRENVFHLIENKAVNRHIARWVKNAEINKKITFHCARHTFATICLTNDIDIYTVSKLLGHKDIASTQIYAKLIDKKRDEAIDKLPSF